MSTTTTTPGATPTTSPSHGRTVFVAAVGVLVAAGLAVGLAVGLGGTTDAPSAAQTVPAAHAGSGTTGGDVHHHVVPTPPAPSAAVETLQRELGQLNYYEGPITGTMTTQTEQAITYLQRDAHLPQTGTMNAATQAALVHFLATGNNQMGA
ncbi:MAG TPA: peptidoglycan-binding domain-containing protein [Pseudonocardia sp.]